MRAYLSGQTLILLAHFVDNYEIQNISEKVNDLSEYLYGGVNSIHISSELKLLGRLFYFVPLLMIDQNGRTIGQDFTSLSMVSVDNVDDKRKPTMKSINTKTLLWLTALQVVLPYLNDRKEFIFNQISILFSEDDLYNQTSTTNQINNTHLPNNTSSNINNNTRTSNAINSSTTCPTVNEPESLIFTLFRALKRSYQSIATSHSGRVDVACKYLQDIHTFLFLLNGRLVELFLCFVVKN